MPNNFEGLEEVGLENIESGRMMQKVNERLAEVVLDVHRRPSLATKRKLTVEIAIEPDETAEGGVQCPAITWCVKVSVPAVSGGTTRGFMQGGKLLVSAQEPDARQTTLPFRQAEEG
jgi:hypothetical protein